jgi:hypothetical protein
MVTYGEIIEKYVQEFEKYDTMAFFILERVLIRLAEINTPEYVTIGGLLVCKTPGYMRRRAANEATLARLRAEGILDDSL